MPDSSSTPRPGDDPTLAASERIRRRLEAAAQRYHANDNIAAYVEDGELDELRGEVEAKMQEVLKALVIDTDGDHILINTEPQRQRSKNVTRNPRITVLIHSADDPWDWAEIRGTVTDTIDGDRARQHIDELSRKYVGTDYQAPIGPHGRIILEVTPDKINTPNR